MSERNWLIPLAAGAARAGEDFRQSMDRMLTQAAASPPAPAARPTVCPCGHPVGETHLCIEGRIYGPCDSEFCGGVCEYDGDCKGECACGEDE